MSQSKLLLLVGVALLSLLSIPNPDNNSRNKEKQESFQKKYSLSRLFDYRDQFEDKQLKNYNLAQIFNLPLREKHNRNDMNRFSLRNLFEY